MADDKKPRLGRAFQREYDFVRWLAQLLEAHPDFSKVTIEPNLYQQGASSRITRVDIAASRKIGRQNQTVIIECKNVPTIYGQAATFAINQLKNYQHAYPGSHLVLAIPGRVPESVANLFLESGIELWDGGQLFKIFQKQVKEQPVLTFEFGLLMGSQPLVSEEELCIVELQSCDAGRLHWMIYQKLVGRIVELLFCPPLNKPVSESPDVSGANRRDFILANYAETGFWRHLQRRYKADYIVVDAKNYSGKVKKKDVLQIANYLKPHGAGMFGIIFSRSGGDASAVVTTAEQWSHYKKLIVNLTDQHVEAMLQAGRAGDATAVLESEIQKFRLLM